MPTVSDERLVEHAQRDPQAFAALYDRYIERIYAYIYRQTQDETLTQDITATTFEKALRNIHKFRWQGVSFCAWLYRIARNETVQHYRRRRFLAPFSGEEALNGQATDHRATEITVQTDEQWHYLRMTVNQLSDKDREIVTLRFFEELSNKEIADILGCSVDNVYLRLHRALKRLRKKFDAPREETIYA